MNKVKIQIFIIAIHFLTLKQLLMKKNFWL